MYNNYLQLAVQVNTHNSWVGTIPINEFKYLGMVPIKESILVKNKSWQGIKRIRDILMLNKVFDDAVFASKFLLTF